MEIEFKTQFEKGSIEIKEEEIFRDDFVIITQFRPTNKNSAIIVKYGPELLELIEALTVMKNYNETGSMFGIAQPEVHPFTEGGYDGKN